VFFGSELSRQVKRSCFVGSELSQKHKRWLFLEVSYLARANVRVFWKRDIPKMQTLVLMAKGDCSQEQRFDLEVILIFF
tara:strand:+ start:2059 stop:2295 length:237 start_codon:yes stop_codon:yes gene_type:complete